MEFSKETLPEEFKDRLSRFDKLFIEATGEPFERDSLYDYEMGCIKQALSFYEYFKEYSEEDYQSFIHEFDSISDLIDAIKDELPFWDPGHSGNSAWASWNLFRCYREKPELVPYMHGCLANLVGDEGYHDDRSDIPTL